MNILQKRRPRVEPTPEAVELGSKPHAEESAAVDGKTRDDVPTGASVSSRLGDEVQRPRNPDSPPSRWSPFTRWLYNDIFYIAMLLLALVGVVLRLSVTYWVVLTPVFGLISIIEGWSHFRTRSERLGLTFRVAAIWCALLLSIYLLYDSSVQSVMNVNATSLAMITLLALGTFVAGIEARVWQICAVGGLLFLSVPGVGWLAMSPLLLTGAAIVIIACGGLFWWIGQGQSAIPAER